LGLFALQFGGRFESVVTAIRKEFQNIEINIYENPFPFTASCKKLCEGKVNIMHRICIIFISAGMYVTHYAYIYKKQYSSVKISFK